MKIISCCKLVIDEQDITIGPDRNLEMSQAGAKISQMDLNALEAAVQLTGEQDSVIALSVGGNLLSNAKLRKDILSRGPDALHLVQSDKLESISSKQTAEILARAANKIGFDLLLFGEGSDDNYAQQVGLLVGEILQLPSTNAVSDITIEDKHVLVKRTLEKEIEVLRLPLPAVLSVTADLNVPRLPTMKAILAAGKKPVVVYNEDDVGWVPSEADVEIVSVRALSQTERKQILIDTNLSDAVGTLVEQISRSLNLAI